MKRRLGAVVGVPPDHDPLYGKDALLLPHVTPSDYFVPTNSPSKYYDDH